MSQDLTIFDAFCGAGGSSTGARATGIRIKAAANHWQLAIDSHNANHPDTDHYCEDLQEIHPREFPYTDLVWMSPECVSHSLSKGKRRKNVTQRGFWDSPYLTDDEIRSRATMREVYDHLEYHRNPIMIVENVVDVHYWEHYETWIKEICNLGYTHKTLYLNSRFFNVPQSRDRWYTVFWRHDVDTPDLDFKPLASCPKHGEVESVQAWKKQQWGKYGKQYIYVCPQCGTREVSPYFVPSLFTVDWSLPSVRISERAQHGLPPLKPNTIARIKAGLKKYAGKMLVIDMSHPQSAHESRVRSGDEPMATITSTLNTAVAMPFFTSTNHQTMRHTPADEPLPTVMPRNNVKLVVPDSFVTSQYTRLSANSPLNEPLPTIPGMKVHALVMAYYNNPVWKTVYESMSTITGKQRHALIEPTDDDVMSCSFRMMEWFELRKGMAFPDDYIILGSSKDVKVKQVGQAVTPPVAQWIIQRCVEALQ